MGIKEAVNAIPAGANIPKEYCEAVNALLDLAQSYLNLKGFPEEKQEINPCDGCKAGESDCRIDCDSYDEYIENLNYNKGRQETILAVMKMGGKIKERILMCLQSPVGEYGSFPYCCKNGELTAKPEIQEGFATILDKAIQSLLIGGE